MKNIIVINGSASKNSSNQKLIDYITQLTKNLFFFTIFSDLKILPHFDPDLSIDNTPKLVLDFRSKIKNADAVLICTPEYVFSIPSGLKNMLEWCVSTTVFSNKPIGIITASSNGEKGHEELQLILKTLMANFSADTSLLIQGLKSKISPDGNIVDDKTTADLTKFIEAFISLTEE